MSKYKLPPKYKMPPRPRKPSPKSAAIKGTRAGEPSAAQRLDEIKLAAAHLGILTAIKAIHGPVAGQNLAGPTLAQMRKAIEVATQVGMALLLGPATVDTPPEKLPARDDRADGEYWERVEQAFEILTGGVGDSGKRRSVVRALEVAIERWNMRGPVGAYAVSPKNRHALSQEALRCAIVQNLKEDLQLIEPKFGLLDAKKLTLWIAKAKPTGEIRKGGAGTMAPALMAARLSVSVAAFGDENEAKSKKRFLAAEQSARR